MKKLSLVLASFMLSIILYAQVTPLDNSKIETLNDNPYNNDSKSSWVCGGFNSYYTGAVIGDEFYIAGSEFSQIDEGNQITKVKFYHKLGIVSFESGNIEFTNTEYTIKIYENPSLGGPYSGLGFYSTDI